MAVAGRCPTCGRKMRNPVLQQRNKRIIGLRASGMTFEDVGKKLGFSAQRAQQIYKELQESGAVSTRTEW